MDYQPIENFDLLEDLGRELFFRAYLARPKGDSDLPNLTLVKVFDWGKLAEVKSSIRREIELGHRISHPGVLKFYEDHLDETLPYIVSEYFDGIDLLKFSEACERELIQRLPMALVITRKILEIHGALIAAIPGIVIRNFAPRDIYINAQGEIKLNHLEIAKLPSDSEESGIIKGYIKYISPEMLDEAPLDPRSDLFAIGALTWKLLTGRDLFEAEDDLSILKKIKESAPLSFDDEVFQDCPEGLKEILSMSLKKSPDQRFQTPEDFSSALDAILRDHFGSFEQEDFASEVERVFIKSSDRTDEPIDFDFDSLEDFGSFGEPNLEAPASLEYQPLERYDLIADLGDEAFGHAYLGKPKDAPLLPEFVVVRILNPETLEEAKKYFERERTLIKRLGENWFLKIYELNFAHETPHVLSEYFSGVDFEAFASKTHRYDRNSRPRALKIMLKILEAFESFERVLSVSFQGFLPQGILLGPGGQVKFKHPGAELLLENSAVIAPEFNLAYLAPEVLKGEPFDQKSDLFSLGCLFLRLLVDQEPFSEETDHEIIGKIVEFSAEGFDRLRREIRLFDTNSELDHLIKKALEPDSKKRYQSAEEFRIGIQNYLSDFHGYFSTDEFEICLNDTISEIQNTSGPFRLEDFDGQSFQDSEIYRTIWELFRPIDSDYSLKEIRAQRWFRHQYIFIGLNLETKALELRVQSPFLEGSSYLEIFESVMSTLSESQEAKVDVDSMMGRITLHLLDFQMLSSEIKGLVGVLEHFIEEGVSADPGHPKKAPILGTFDGVFEDRELLRQELQSFSENASGSRIEVDLRSELVSEVLWDVAGTMPLGELLTDESVDEVRITDGLVTYVRDFKIQRYSKIPISVAQLEELLEPLQKNVISRVQNSIASSTLSKIENYYLLRKIKLPQSEIYRIQKHLASASWEKFVEINLITSELKDFLKFLEGRRCLFIGICSDFASELLQRIINDSYSLIHLGEIPRSEKSDLDDFHYTFIQKSSLTEKETLVNLADSLKGIGFNSIVMENCEGPELWGLIQLARKGYSLTMSLEADSFDELANSVYSMCLEADPTLARFTVMEALVRSFDCVVHLRRDSVFRKVISVTSMGLTFDGEIKATDIFHLTDAGELEFTGYLPGAVRDLERKFHPLPSFMKEKTKK
jgi:eukaryotic-like serine/threonine-protein kinase